MNDRTHRRTKITQRIAMIDLLMTAAGTAGGVPSAQRIKPIRPVMVPRNPSRAKAAAACMAWFLVVGLIMTRKPRMAKTMPKYIGISAVGCCEPVRVKPRIPSAIKSAAKMMVILAMKVA